MEANTISVSKHFPGLAVHVQKGSRLANNVSVHDLASIAGVSVVMDTSKEQSIAVNLNDGSTIKFLKSADGIYFFDT